MSLSLSSVRTCLLVGLSATLLGACVQVLGNEFVIVEEDPSTSSSGSGGAGGGGGAGGLGGASSSAAGGAGGMAGPGCNPLDLTVCGAGSKCGVVDLNNGGTDCVAAGSRAPFAACAMDADCQTGTFCSPLRKVCKPYCQMTSQCPAASVCRQAWVALNTPVPGIGECIAQCDPVAGQAQSICGTGTTCSYNTVAVAPQEALFDCVRAGTSGFDGACTASMPDDFTRECGYGLDCFFLGGSHLCRPWCLPIGQQGNCPVQYGCTDAGASPQLGITYGACL